MNLKATFESYEDDFLEFDAIENKLSNRPDLHAFILLDSLVPGKTDIVSAAEHDEIWLEVDPAELAKVITDKEVQELVRCGVRYDDQYDALKMFV